MFVRSRDEKGKEFLEFATALNVSAGGALVAVRRSTALSAGFPRNSQRTPSQRCRSSQSISNRARPICPRNPRGGLSSDRLKIFPSAPESHSRTPARSKETCFSGVKIFSYRQSQFRAVISSFLACICVFAIFLPLPFKHHLALELGHRSKYAD